MSIATDKSSTDSKLSIRERLTKAAAFFGRSSYAAIINRLLLELQQRDAVIEAQALALAHSRKTFDHSSAAARIGVWECSLPDETLTWTDVVYDIFDLPRGTMPDRRATLALYTEASAAELKMRRSQAIAERSGFSMEAEIVTSRGNHRWIRITATVECEDSVPVRIFGMKQDITDAKNLFDRTRYLADFDMMTGLANRAQFQTKLPIFCEDHSHAVDAAALLLVDLDGFKIVNDTYGHAAGDDCLQETADRLRKVCRDAPLIARLGGDEFAVLFQPGAGKSAIAALADDIVQILRRPMHHADRHLQIGASVGVAFVDGSSPTELYQRADMALYAAKAAGRNTFHIFNPTAPEARANYRPRSAA